MLGAIGRKLRVFLRRMVHNPYRVVGEGELRARDSVIVRGICRRLARGNISLQQGLFVDSAQIALRRKKNDEYALVVKKYLLKHGS